ncbi:hypothetical protein DFH06DRAFT_1402760 [Mycena polygramma]|nr:hypothetical protein DFH06DRAFT_1402760 [Mycena polygramma]
MSRSHRWTPVRSLSGCGPLISSFWAEVGEDAFLINFPGFVVEPNAQWIVGFEEKQKAGRPLRSRVMLQAPAPPTSRHRRRVSFVPTMGLRVTPALDDIENTAQEHCTVQKRAYESDNETPIFNFRPSKVLRRVLSVRYLVSDFPLNLKPTPSRRQPSRTLHWTKLPKNRLPSPYPRSIKIYEPPLDAGSKLATKKRLSVATVAPGIPRASPSPTAPAEYCMSFGTAPTLLPLEENSDAEFSPTLATMFAGNVDPSHTGFYGMNEDRYAAFPKNGDLVNLGSEFDSDGDGELGAVTTASSGEVDEFLNSIESCVGHKSPPCEYHDSILPGRFLNSNSALRLMAGEEFDPAATASFAGKYYCAACLSRSYPTAKALKVSRRNLTANNAFLLWGQILPHLSHLSLAVGFDCETYATPVAVTSDCVPRCLRSDPTATSFTPE